MTSPCEFLTILFSCEDEDWMCKCEYWDEDVGDCMHDSCVWNEYKEDEDLRAICNNCPRKEFLFGTKT